MNEKKCKYCGEPVTPGKDTCYPCRSALDWAEAILAGDAKVENAPANEQDRIRGFVFTTERR